MSIEVIPQGLLSERLRAGGAGLGGVFSPVGVNTSLSDSYEIQEIDGKQCLFLEALRGDFALISAHSPMNWETWYTKESKETGGLSWLWQPT
ncbi:MAG: hypothetical protein CM1200mP15_06520 [Dehalococcoidia bacterium]|nr:MAG: hypothetical protein CM1200mP15_06520 [Dehalococcoidia bacterium]